MPTPPSPHVDVAAYVLGILDKPDEAAFAAHFAACAQCRTEYRELSDLPRLLDQVKAGPPEQRRATASEPVAPARDLLGPVLEQISFARGRQRMTMWLAAAAAVVLLVTVPLVVWKSAGADRSPLDTGVAFSRQEAPPLPSTTAAVAGAHIVRGANPASGVTATITVQPEPWGTQIDLELRGVTGPMQCQLVAVSRSGHSQVVASWSVPVTGFGVPGSPESLHVRGGVGFTESDIERFDVRRDNGQDLVRVPA